MIIIANVLVALVALIHVYILVLEMFLWTSPPGHRAFGTTPQFAQQTRVLGMNQGLYNGFLAAGLVWGLVAGGDTGFAAKVFFLVCIAIAGIFGAATASRRILFVQTVPAVLALLFVIAAR
jgi:putative membrane protein